MPILLLYVALMLGLSQCLRGAQRRGRDVLVVTAVNYAVGLAVLLPAWLVVGSAGINGRTLGLGVLNGGLFFAHLLVLLRAFQVAGVGVAAAATQSSVVVPPVVAAVFLNEPMHAGQVAALAMAPVALWLLRPSVGVPTDDTQTIPAGAGAWLLASFAMAGVIYSVHKFAVHAGADTTGGRLGYLLCIFVAAGVVAFGTLTWRGRRVTRADLRWALPVGLCNSLGVLSLLAALAALPAAVVYTTAGPCTTTLNALVARVLFHERLQRRQLLGIAMVLAVLGLVHA